MTASEIGGTLGISLFVAGPASVIFGKLTKSKGPLTSLKMCFLSWGILTAAIPFFFSEPSQKELYPLIAILLGLGFGWQFPVDRDVFVSMIPRGQETEVRLYIVSPIFLHSYSLPPPQLMGVYVFAGGVIAWFPPLVFTIMVNLDLGERAKRSDPNQIWGRVLR